MTLAFSSQNMSISSDRKSVEPFQRKKIGSIRDNPKLSKIRQQFESGSWERERSKDLRRNSSNSAPSSISGSLSQLSGKLFLNDFLSSNKQFYGTKDGCSRTSKCNSVAPSRQNSTQKEEEPILSSSVNSKQVLEEIESTQKFWRTSSSADSAQKSSAFTSYHKLSSSSNSRPLRDKTNAFSVKDIEANKQTAPGDVSPESGVHTCSSTSEDDNFSSASNNSKAENRSQNEQDSDRNPPPIPRRGISPAVQNCLSYSRPSPKKQVPSPVKDLSSPQNVIKSDSVRKAIQLYEGMSSDTKKIRNSVKNTDNHSKTTARKENHLESNSRKNGIYRRSSKRNSMRKKSSTNRDDVNKAVVQTSVPPTPSEEPTYHHIKEDSGVVLSDSEDFKTQGIYQTLTEVNPPRNQFDPYDRLNRIHDMVNRIHKGQSSTCAACKAIPSGSLQYTTDNPSSLLQVECKELSPHHHPPCICFSCQHSVFSCSQNTENPEDIAREEDSLYYNVCCLNPPNREGWRQSRRRPICEQNGRVCIVNCDMEKEGCQVQEKFYENLSEWESVPSDMVPKMRHPSKPMSGDSCDSDEGWVDVTDSEDEKNSIAIAKYGRTMISRQASNKSSSKRTVQRLLVENSTYNNKDLLSVKGNDSLLDISRSSSTEHLYESIADMEYQNLNCTFEDGLTEITSDLSTLSLKTEQTPENELDSGEWSTESPSPTFEEPPSQIIDSDLVSKVPLSRFALGTDCQETAKKTFMKSVLGGKNAKKRRMSNFFVPWLVSNQEYGPSSRSHKSGVKKQISHPHRSTAESSSKTREGMKSKRSQSVPSCASGLSMSCTKGLFSSAEGLEIADLELNSGRHSDSGFCENDPSLSPRGSVASSAYLRADQLQSLPILKFKPTVSIDSAVDVSIERVRRRASSGDSEHSYILFQPVKEEEVPLYQFYERNIKERVSFCRSPGSMSPIMWSSLPEMSNEMGVKATVTKPQLSVVEQLSPDAKDMKMLWCELPEVKDSGILERISAQELKLQEAAFEFIQSQASYVRSLKVLYEYFIRTPEFSQIDSALCVLSKHEHDVLFSDIVRVKDVSEKLMGELTSRWSEGILIPDICDIIRQHAALPSFSVYVKYCSNRVYQEKTLKELKESRLCFLEVLRKLESNPACQGFSLESFLFLPMQHISRLPLLLDNIYRWLVPDSPSYDTCKQALEAVHKIFMECNEGARKMERLEEMFVLNKQLEFKECKVIPLISASRWLLKKGELMKLEFDKKTFGRSSRCVRVPVYIFLFNDLLVITKRKSEDSYMVVDYCLREKVQAMPVNAKDLQQPVVVPNSCRYLIYLTLFNNHQGSAVDMIINCTLLSERTRWIEAIHTVSQNKPCEVWEYDCPQVQCVRSYIAEQPDELSLQESDVVTIHRKMNDGWYEGRRLRDGLQGWFPASYTMDIPCSRARASNLRQCYRLLMLSQQ